MWVWLETESGRVENEVEKVEREVEAGRIEKAWEGQQQMTCFFYYS